MCDAECVLHEAGDQKKGKGRWLVTPGVPQSSEKRLLALASDSCVCPHVDAHLSTGGACLLRRPSQALRAVLARRLPLAGTAVGERSRWAAAAGPCRPSAEGRAVRRRSGPAEQRRMAEEQASASRQCCSGHALDLARPLACGPGCWRQPESFEVMEAFDQQATPSTTSGLPPPEQGAEKEHVDTLPGSSAPHSGVLDSWRSSNP